MITELSLPSSVMRRNKLDVSLGYCNEIFPGRLPSLGPVLEVRVDNVTELIELLTHDVEDGHIYFVNHLREKDKEWEYVCFARQGEWTIFCSVFSTALAYNPLFGDGKRRRLCSGGTRIIGKTDLQQALHRELSQPSQELVHALLMNLDLSEAMTGKNLSNGFNIGGSKTLVYVGDCSGDHVIPERAREFASFMAQFHNSIMQSLPLFIGTGSDLNFKEHGDLYYNLCSRLSPSYVGNPLAAKRWGRETAEDTTIPTADGVIASIEAVSKYLNLQGDDRSILIKGLGGVGSLVARYYVTQGWTVYATDIDTARLENLCQEFGSSIFPIREEDWANIPSVRIFSPNSSSGSLTRDNLQLLSKLGVQAVVGGENNIRDKGLNEDVIYKETGILTFADFLLNGGGAWIVDAEMIERPVADVQDWIQNYQIPTVIRTIELAKKIGRSPESIFIEFIQNKVKELVA